LGTVSVCGRIRLPIPAIGTMIFIGGGEKGKSGFVFDRYSFWLESFHRKETPEPSMMLPDCYI
jgi:hypothetical protein